MKSLWRIARLAIPAVALTLMAAGANAQTQAYPSKPIRWIVPFPPGGSTDLLARVVGQKLTESVGPAGDRREPRRRGRHAGRGRSRARAGGRLYAADGRDPPHDRDQRLPEACRTTSSSDFAPITVVAIVPNVLVVNPSVPANSTKELIAYAKANPGKLTYGSAGMGTAHHLIGEVFNLRAGAEIVHVPYKGSAPAVADLIGGQVSIMYDTVASCLPHVKSGKLRPLAVATAKRSSALPDVPTIAEAALPGFEVTTWFGALAPAKTPPEIVAKLNAEMVKILEHARRDESGCSRPVPSRSATRPSRWPRRSSARPKSSARSSSRRRSPPSRGSP